MELENLLEDIINENEEEILDEAINLNKKNFEKVTKMLFDDFYYTLNELKKGNLKFTPVKLINTEGSLAYQVEYLEDMLKKRKIFKYSSTSIIIS